MTSHEPIAGARPGASADQRRTFRRDPRDILRLLHCPQCDYNLEGLPRRHRCPECGFEYDEFMFAVYGWHSVGDRPGVWRTVGSLAVLLLCGLSVVFTPPAPGLVWVPALSFTVLGALVADTWIRRRRAQREQGGVIQLVFSAAGACRRVGPGPVDFVPWTEFRGFRIREVGRNAWHLRLGRGLWRLYLHGKSMRPLLGTPLVEGTIECNRREAALLRREIQRRLGACRARRT